MLTNALRALDKKFKVEGLSWKLCIQHIETLKSNFLTYNSSIISFFEYLTSVLRALVNKTLFILISFNRKDSLNNLNMFKHYFTRKKLEYVQIY